MEQELTRRSRAFSIACKNIDDYIKQRLRELENDDDTTSGDVYTAMLDVKWKTIEEMHNMDKLQ